MWDENWQKKRKQIITVIKLVTNLGTLNINRSEIN